ncbi:MAG: hypothetical protein Kow00108_15280 [Calditrichia bacterium]
MPTRKKDEQPDEKKSTTGSRKKSTSKKTTTSKSKTTATKTKKEKTKPLKPKAAEEKSEPAKTSVQEVEFEVIDEQPVSDKSTQAKPVANFFNEVEKLAKDGFAFLRKTADKMKEFSSEAAELTKLKLEHKKYVDEKEALIKKLGEHVWRLQKESSLTDLQDKFSDIFSSLEELEKKIAAKKEEIEKIQLIK